jgi:hypothetical protein
MLAGKYNVDLKYAGRRPCRNTGSRFPDNAILEERTDNCLQKKKYSRACKA